MRSFEPVIQVVQADQSLLVLFDSASSEDITRTTRLVQVPLPVQEIAWDIKPVVDEEISVYHVNLVVKQADGETTYLLGKVTVPVTNNILHILRQGIANAFAAALTIYLHKQSRVGELASQLPNSSYEPVPARRLASVHRPEDSYRTPNSASVPKSAFRSAAVFAVVGIVGFALFAGYSALFGHNADPIQTAVAQNMVQDPAAIAAQVELTKETLKQMGLDPGAAGDLGCLAPR